MPDVPFMIVKAGLTSDSVMVSTLRLKARDFNVTSLSIYDFSTLYTTLPHSLIKDKLIDLIERTFQREGSPYLVCNDRNAFFLLQ